MLMKKGRAQVSAAFLVGLSLKNSPRARESRTDPRRHGRRNEQISIEELS
jgi:hypothetical protein